MSGTPRNYSLVNPGDVHDVATNAQRLGVLFTVSVELARVIGGWICRSPELPEKLALGKMTFEDADAASAIDTRLRELRLSEDDLDKLRRRTTKALKGLEHAESPHAFLAGLVRVVKPAFIADLRRHLDAAPPYVDEPTVRILSRVIAEQEQHVAKGLSLLADRSVSWTEYVAFEDELRTGLWSLRDEGGAMIPDEFVGREPVTLARPRWPEAVQQLAYEEAGPTYPQDFDSAMRRCVHDLIFSEVEALDIFGHYVYAFAGTDFPWEFHREAARIAWDEARHVELLLNVLDRYDGTLGEFPAKASGYEEYVRQENILEKIIMVNVIAEGEVSTDTQTQHRDAFRELGDELSATLKDYEMADEVVHGRFGLVWSRWVAERTGADYAAAYQRALTALEEFKSSLEDEGGESPIPLIRLGADETSSKRVMNLEAKRLAGFTEEDIARMRKQAGSVVEA